MAYPFGGGIWNPTAPRGPGAPMDPNATQGPYGPVGPVYGSVQDQYKRAGIPESGLPAYPGGNPLPRLPGPTSGSHAGMVLKPGESGNEASDWIPAPGGGGGGGEFPRYPLPQWPGSPDFPQPNDPHAGMVLKPGESGNEASDWIPAGGGGSKFPGNWPSPPIPPPDWWKTGNPQDPPPFYRPSVDPGGYIPTDRQRQEEEAWYRANWPGWGQGGGALKQILLGGGTLGSIGTFNGMGQSRLMPGNPWQSVYAGLGNTLGKLYGG